MQDLSVQISTVNGTGSQTANKLLTKMLFRCGFKPGSYNFFPSNIAGLPCSYFLRINALGRTALQDKTDLLISLNPQTLARDLTRLKPSGVLIKDKKDPLFSNLPLPRRVLELPLNQSLLQLPSASFKMKKALRNMISTGLLSQWMGLSEKVCQKVLEDSFKTSVLDLNQKAFEEGRRLAKEAALDLKINIAPSAAVSSEKRILTDGNSAMALGALFSSCKLLSWYPITPATGLAESFEKYARIIEPGEEKTIISLQAEDETAALGHVLGAGWAGLRAMTATSGPGLSLMTEGAGLGYFAEVPAVICNVQRAGPSTGLPTRTAQGDLLSSCFLSHGDTKHIVLLPGTVKECFSLCALAFDLADQLQTPVILLSDLDLAMNLESSPPIPFPKTPLKRGKILSADQLDEFHFQRYSAQFEDGVSYRVLPGADHTKSGYLTRGSGHNENADYSEEPEDYRKMQDKLKKKWNFAKSLMPKPLILEAEDSLKAFVTFGKNENAVKEAVDILEEKGIRFNLLRILSYPWHPAAEEFLKKQEEIYVVEQNRDGQLKQLLLGECPCLKGKMHSILRYDGRPFSASNITDHF